MLHLRLIGIRMSYLVLYLWASLAVLEQWIRHRFHLLLSSQVQAFITFHLSVLQGLIGPMAAIWPIVSRLLQGVPGSQLSHSSSLQHTAWVSDMDRLAIACLRDPAEPSPPKAGSHAQPTWLATGKVPVPAAAILGLSNVCSAAEGDRDSELPLASWCHPPRLRKC